MRITQFSTLCTALLLCLVLAISVASLTNVHGVDQMIMFTRVPSGYANETGSFKLGSQLSHNGVRGNGRVCVTFDYFIFNAQAGQVLQGKMEPGSTGNKPVYYLILNSPTQLNVFQNSGCGLGNWQLQTFTSPTTISWTVAEDGQYALIFAVSGFYSGLLYFLP